jgi:hypothetical protein
MVVHMHARAANLACIVLALLLSSMAASPVRAQGVSPPPAPAMPGGGEVITLGADAEVFRDDFATPGAWAVGDHETGRIESLGGALRFTTTKAPDPRWNWLDLALAAPVLWARVAIDLGPEGGAAGPMCGVTTSPAILYFGIVNTAGEWVVGRTRDSELSVLARGPLPEQLRLARGGQAVLAIECAVTGQSGARVALTVDGVNVADVSVADAVSSFFGPGLYGEGYADGFEVKMDDLVVAMGAVYAPLLRTSVRQPPIASETVPPPTAAPATQAPASSSPVSRPDLSPAASGSVLSHVPVTYRDACQPAESDPTNGLLDTVSCSPAGEAETAVYFLYDSVETLEAAFEGLLAARGAITDGTDCSIGPALVDYTIGGQTAGKLACFVQDDVAAALWTDRRLRVLAFGVKSEQDFAGLYEWWLEAGPVG